MVGARTTLQAEGLNCEFPQADTHHPQHTAARDLHRQRISAMSRLTSRDCVIRKMHHNLGFWKFTSLSDRTVHLG